MSLIELIAGVEADEATLTVFNADPSVRASLAEHFADRNVRVIDGDATPGPAQFAVLSRDGTYEAATSVDELLPYRSGHDTADSNSTSTTNGGASGTGEGSHRSEAATEGSTGSDATNGSNPSKESDAPGVSPRTGGPVLDQLDETLFTSYSSAEMVAASREIEDRAWRIGRGELHAGFQTLDVLQGERGTYDKLSEREDLTIFTYASAEGDQPEETPYIVRISETPEIRETWFLAFDGGGVDAAKCALLAEERDPGSYYGFWSYDPDTVDRVIAHLRERYGPYERFGDEGALL